MALAMSRSIGDKDGAPLGVIPDPTIDKLDLTTIATSDLGLFAVVASDGLLDRLDEKQVAESIASSLFSSHAKKQTPLEACEELIMKSSRGWIASGMPYRDDISVATSILVRDSSI
jgi:serine/threonine protein phosphatase PrpC